MRKLSFGKVLKCFSLSSRSSSSLSNNSFVKKKDVSERKPLIAIEGAELIKMKNGGSSKALVSPFKPKMVMLRVSMHCNGCARKVEKHITRIEGVSSCHVDLKTKLVTVIGDNIVPHQVLKSISKVKNAELLTVTPSYQEVNLLKEK